MTLDKYTHQWNLCFGCPGRRAAMDDVTPIVSGTYRVYDLHNEQYGCRCIYRVAVKAALPAYLPVQEVIKYATDERGEDA